MNKGGFFHPPLAFRTINMAGEGFTPRPSVYKTDDRRAGSFLLPNSLPKLLFPAQIVCLRQHNLLQILVSPVGIEPTTP